MRADAQVSYFLDRSHLPTTPLLRCSNRDPEVTTTAKRTRTMMKRRKGVKRPRGSRRDAHEGGRRGYGMGCSTQGAMMISRSLTLMQCAYAVAVGGKCVFEREANRHDLMHNDIDGKYNSSRRFYKIITPNHPSHPPRTPPCPACNGTSSRAHSS